jgi:serine/threonine protein kinase/WD40 repeat protein
MGDASLVEEIFLAALEHTEPHERTGYLDEACRGDAGLRGRVERLLEAHGKAGRFLEGPGGPDGDETVAHVPPAERAGAVIAGRFKLLEPIGEGGMGTVWVAEQTQPVRRKVALKLIKAGMDSKTVLARFEAERQALALMDHPNIAKVLDGGATELGRPFFVMEYVKGVPITEYCDDARLPVEERLALFVPVCQAVQHAHQKGIVHRDLKPSNILVCLYDGRPVPKVIDFGLAKAMHQPLTEHTLLTGHGLVMGTPLYMSPEQAELNNLDVDTRTDVYSLGVILYELLTGSTPLEKRRFQEAAWQEMVRLIKEEDPPRPSTRLTGGGTPPSVAAQRRMEPMKLGRLLRGELDWVVMKALEKDRNRRYETASRFGSDVELFLKGEPVSAVPPSAGYRLRKLLRKHRPVAAAAGLVLAALLIGVVGIVWGLVREAAARRAAEEAFRRERVQSARAEAARRDAERNAASLTIDRDLEELRADPKLGLLHLARTAAGVPEGADDLREFATLAVLAAGQQIIPLLPPIRHDGAKILRSHLASGGRRLLTYGEDFTARLWDPLTARSVAVLREGDERVVDGDLSADGRWAFTRDAAGVARFWDATDGSLRARTEARPDSEVAPPGDDPYRLLGGSIFSPHGDTLVTRRAPDPRGDKPGHWRGPAELWDARSGRLIARLDRPGLDADGLQFAADGRWITALEADGSLRLISAPDGRPVGRLEGAADEPIRHVSVTPSGQRIATYGEVGEGGNRYRVRLWDGRTLRPLDVALPPADGFYDVFLSDELFLTSPEAATGKQWALRFPPDGGEPERVPVPEPIPTDFFGMPPRVAGDRYLPALGNLGWLYDTNTWRHLTPPPGRAYHPDLRRFAPDGRFVLIDRPGIETNVSASDLLDTRTEKVFRLEEHPHQPTGEGVEHVDGFGWVAVVGDGFGGGGCRVSVVPPASRPIPPDVLELWAQVVVRGEIGPDGQFARWDEPTWEGKRQQLAARPAPDPSFPFPGQVAVDRLHWLRREYEEAGDDGKPSLAKQLLDRAEALGDRAEAARWRKIASSSPDPPARPR